MAKELRRPANNTAILPDGRRAGGGRDVAVGMEKGVPCDAGHVGMGKL